MYSLCTVWVEIVPDSKQLKLASFYFYSFSINSSLFCLFLLITMFNAVIYLYFVCYFT